MPKSKDQEVWIECEGVRCEEYANKTDGNAITCYIESQVDKTFTISWRNDISYVSNQLEVAIHIDGMLMDAFVPKKPKATSLGLFTAEDRHMKYKFSALNSTEDEDGYHSNELGIITVKLYRILVTEMSNASFTRSVPGDIQKPISETSKKLSSHRIGLEEEVRRTSRRSTVKVMHLDTEPLATFNFLYRSKELLQALGVIQPAAGIAKSRKRPLSRSSVLNETRGVKSPRIKTESAVIEVSDGEEDYEQILLKQMASISRKLTRYRREKGRMSRTQAENKENSRNQTSAVVAIPEAINLTRN